MELNWVFMVNSLLLGVGLAMDAFSVSLANGLNDPYMGRARMLRIAGCFAFFQFLMPMVGWVCVRTVARAFAAFQRAVPWIALALLAYIGGKMLVEGIWGKEEADRELGNGTLLMQGVATSIDALSVGFAIAEYPSPMALMASLLIAGVTFAICLAGVAIGRRFGMRLAGRASILGGAVLIFIGVRILLSSL